MANTIIDKQGALLSEAFGRALVTCEMTRKAFVCGASIKLLWATAGAGLAERHRQAGISVTDLGAALKDERKGNPYLKDYIDGYNSAMLQARMAATGRVGA